MVISLQTSTGQNIGDYKSSSIPRKDELIYYRIVGSAPALFRVVSVFYYVQQTEESNQVILEIIPVDDAARQYICEVVYN